MKFQSFIVVDKKLSNGVANFYTVIGEVYIPLESVVPIISNGKCIGLGVIKALHITSSSTEIEFLFENGISKEKRAAYYDLYRNNASNADSYDDPYENQDQVIPGAMAYGAKPKKSKNRYGGNSVFDNLDLDY